MSIRGKKVGPTLLLALFVLLVLIPNAPSHQEEILRDSGVFLYTGQQILDGKIPYRDVWDHKGPVIYYLNAMFLLLSGGSLWGIWALELLSLGAAAALSYALLKQALGAVPALFGTLTWLAGLHFFFNGGNLTEEYALPWQFAALFLFWRSMQSTRAQYGRFLLMGLTAGTAFFLRPNNIGVQLSIVMLTGLEALHSSEWKKWAIRTGAIISGVLLVGFAIGAYFLANDAFQDFYSALLPFNFAYTSAAWSDRWQSLVEGYKFLAPSGLQFVILPTWLSALILMLRKRAAPMPRISLLQLALIGLPLELFLSTVSGKSFEHYYIMWLPVMGLLAGYFAYGVLAYLANPTSLAALPSGYRRWIGMVALVGVMVTPSWRLLPTLEPAENAEHSLISQQLQAYLEPGKSLLLWGAETEYNFLTGAAAPSRFVYQYPLYECKFERTGFIAEFAGDIAANKPLIVDTSIMNAKVPPIDPQRRAEWQTNGAVCLHPDMDKIFSWIEANYQVAGTAGPDRWPILKWNNNAQNP